MQDEEERLDEANLPSINGRKLKPLNPSLGVDEVCLDDAHLSDRHGQVLFDLEYLLPALGRMNTLFKAMDVVMSYENWIHSPIVKAILFCNLGS